MTGATVYRTELDKTSGINKCRETPATDGFKIYFAIRQPKQYTESKIQIIYKK